MIEVYFFFYFGTYIMSLRVEENISQVTAATSLRIICGNRRDAHRKLHAIYGRFDEQMIGFDNKFSQFLNVAECCNVPWLFVNNNCNHMKK